MTQILFTAIVFLVGIVVGEVVKPIQRLMESGR